MMDADDAARMSFYSHNTEDRYSMSEPFLDQRKQRNQGVQSMLAQRATAAFQQLHPAQQGAAALHCLVVLCKVPE